MSRGNLPWWQQEKNPHEAIFSLVRDQYSKQAGRYQTFRRFRNVYEYGWKGVERTARYDRSFDDTQLHFNRAQNAVDTVVAEVTSAKLAPMATTEGGTWAQRENAERATRALDGLFQELHMDKLFEEACIDACLAGCGFIKCFADLEACVVRAERVDPMDLIIDEREAIAAEPRCMYQRMLVDRWYLAEKFGVPSDALEASASTRRQKILDAGIPDLFPGEIWDTDSLVEVVEAWHLPSVLHDDDGDADDKDDAPRRRSKKTDGRHVLCIDDFTLFDEDYLKAQFPFVVFRPKRARRGYWGIPLMRQLAPGQREAEELDRKLQKAHRRMGGAHFLVHRSAKLDKRKLTNDQGDIQEWEGNIKPEEWTPTPAHPQTYQYRDTIAADMLRFIGSSQFAAQSSVPRGMENSSGRALQLVVDQGSKYLGPWLRDRERLVVDGSDRLLDAVGDVVANDGKYESRYVKGKGYERIDWGPIIKDRKSFTIRVEPINALSTSPGARVAQATEWLQAGAFDPNNPGARQWRRLSGIPDLEAENELDMADDEIIRKTLDWMVTTGKPASPEPFDDLELILSVGRKFVNMCRRQDVPDERMVNVRNYLTDAKALLDEEEAKKAAAAQAMAPPPMPPDGGQPMPMPGMSPMPPEMMAPPEGAMPPPDLLPPELVPQAA